MNNYDLFAAVQRKREAEAEMLIVFDQIKDYHKNETTGRIKALAAAKVLGYIPKTSTHGFWKGGGQYLTQRQMQAKFPKK